MDRLCQCGAVLSLMYRGTICRDCREKAKFLKRSKVHQDNVKSWRDIGHIQVHSCLGNIADKVASDFCACKKFVSKSRASELVSKGLAVDFESRHDYFFNRAILLKKALRTPRSQTIDRTQVETGVQNIQFSAPKFQTTEQIEKTRIDEYKLLQQRLQQERSDKAAERERWDIYQELSVEALRAITIDVSDGEWKRLEKLNKDIPVVTTSFVDDRTLGGVGRDCGPQQVFEDEENESTDVEYQKAGEASEPEEGSPSDQGIDPDFLENDDEEIDEDFVGITPADEEMTTWQPES
jgi:hypothetical protein